MDQFQKICINDFLPDGCLAGYDKNGRQIVFIEFTPNYKCINGTEDDYDQVHEWHVCKDHAYRMFMMEAWRSSDYRCLGSA